MQRIYKIPKFDKINNGELGVLEKTIPFKIKRIFFLKKFKKRGDHVNLKTSMLVFCIQGKIKITILNKLKKKKNYILNNPYKALLINPGEWREILCLKKNSILISICSTHYNKKEYA